MSRSSRGRLKRYGEGSFSELGVGFDGAGAGSLLSLIPSAVAGVGVGVERCEGVCF
jgi:hypothetical protein